MITIEKVEYYKGEWELKITTNGLTEEQLENATRICSKQYARTIENDKTVTVYTKKSFENFERELMAVDANNTTQLEEKSAVRRITSLADAQNRGLNHGRAWIATPEQVEAQKVPAAFVDEYVCYVYE